MSNVTQKKLSPLLQNAEVKYAALTIDEVDVQGIFTGYASLFGQIDLGKDVVERGAFAKSLRQRGAQGVRMLFQHDPNLPIGIWLDIHEDHRGLFVRGRLAKDAAKAGEVLALMRESALDGLSIGFKTVRARQDAQLGVRRIIEADLWEISIVTFPMLPDARISEVKAEKKAFPTIREFERMLVRDAQLTRNQARTVITKGFHHLVQQRDAARFSEKGLSAIIMDAASQFKQSTRNLRKSL